MAGNRYRRISRDDANKKAAVDHGSSNRQGHHFPTTDPSRTAGSFFLPVFKEILGTFFVNSVIQRANHDEHYHDDDISLHEGWWHEA